MTTGGFFSGYLVDTQAALFLEQSEPYNKLMPLAFEHGFSLDPKHILKTIKHLHHEDRCPTRNG